MNHTRVGKFISHMQDKQKVTLYIPPELHRQLKIRSAVDSEPMSAMAERAIVFYLSHPDVVDAVEATYGNTHRVYQCPECDSSLVLREGDMVSIDKQPSIIADEEISVEQARQANSSHDRPGEEELVPC